MGRDVATLFVALSVAVVLAAMAYLRVAAPRHDPWQPEELSMFEPGDLVEWPCSTATQPFGGVAYGKVLACNPDGWTTIQPDDGSGNFGLNTKVFVVRKRLGPPFPSPGGGVRKC